MDQLANLEPELLHLLEVLIPNDCDIQSLVIGLNPNFDRGSDQDLRPIVQNILDRLVNNGVLTVKNKTITVFTKSPNVKTKRKKLRLYSSAL